MMTYSVYDKTTKKAETFHHLITAKKRMKELMKLGHEVSGSKTKVYSNGDWEPCGEITLTGSNKTFIANSRQTKPGY